MAPVSTLPALGFVDRMQRLGLDFEKEVSRAVEVAVQSSQSEVQLLQEEVEWLQKQLHAERSQSDVRLETCKDLQLQLQDSQEQHSQQREAADYWRAEFNVKEEQYSLLEAKLAAMALSEAEAAESSNQALESPGRSKSKVEGEQLETNAANFEPRSAMAVPQESHLDDTRIQGLLNMLEDNGSGMDVQLEHLGMEGFHRMLLAALHREAGSGVLLNRIVRSWACCLLNRQDGLAIKTAVAMGNLEALEALVSLGGTGAVAAAAIAPSSDNLQEVTKGSTDRGDLICSCAAKGDCASLALLVDHLHDRKALELIREARAVAAQHGQGEASQLLATHLVVELSYVGNTKYRAGEYDNAINCYQEAIDLCEEHGGPGAAQGIGANAVATCNRDNLVRLRYNLARAFHRSDRWMEAREQATAVLQLDRQYLNAYALRAQAAMSALDWSAAKEDWERLLAEQGVCSSMSQEVLRAWRRRKDECSRQLAQDHYEALGLPRLADFEEVRKAYHDLARRWHPDKHQSRPSDLRTKAAKRFGRIREAYEVLSDEASKRAYDTELLLLEQARPLATSRGRCSGSFERKDLFDHLFERAWQDEQML